MQRNAFMHEPIEDKDMPVRVQLAARQPRAKANMVEAFAKALGKKYNTEVVVTPRNSH